MLCRRCGLDSSTTDTCEWCNRPMLPAGASVSVKAARELKQSGKPLVVPPPPAVEPEAGLPLQQQEQAEEPEGVEAEETPQQAGLDVVLRPLGHGQATAEQPAVSQASSPAAPERSGPSHGLVDSAMQTSIDISQYMGADQSIFRPINRDEGFSSAASMDRVITQRKGAAQGPGSDWTENDRLKRCGIAGLLICIVFALAQFFITHSVADKLFTVIPLGPGSNVVTAVKLGIASGLAFGFMLGALLVKTQKGPGVGMLLGIVLGFSAVGSFNIFNVLAGALCGIFAGRFATLGVRRVINV